MTGLLGAEDGVEVVAVRGRSLERAQHDSLRADLPGERLGDARADQLLEEDGGHALLLREARHLRQPARRGLVLGGQAADRHLLEVCC